MNLAPREDTMPGSEHPAGSQAIPVNFADETLVGLAQRGDLDAQEEIFRRYLPLVRKRSRAYYLPGGATDDLLQEGLIGLLKGIRDFRAEKGLFQHFAVLCINRQVITAIKTSTRLKHHILNRATSLDQSRYSDPDSPTLLDRLLACRKGQVDPRKRERELTVLEEAPTILTPYEFQILRVYLQGFNYQEIADLLDRSFKSVDSAVFKVKLKLRKRLAELEVLDRNPTWSH